MWICFPRSRVCAVRLFMFCKNQKLIKPFSSKNTVNILIKNMLDAFIGGISYWALGWGLAYGADGNLFCGGSQFLNVYLPYDQYPKWFFQVS